MSLLEWCGLLNDSNENIKLRPDNRVYKTELYSDFIEENPDFAPKSKFTISRIGFQKWLHSYCVYKYNNNPEEGRDLGGRWILFREKYEV